MIRRAQPWMGTIVEVTIAQPLEQPPGQGTRSVPAARHDAAPSATTLAIDAAFAAIALVHRRMSFHSPDSDVSAINRLAVGASCAVDPHTAKVLRCAMMLEEASQGLFNIACADALKAWGQLPAPVGGQVSADAVACAIDDPADAASRAMREGGAGGMMRGVLAVDANDHVTRLHPGAIDLGGIAKGYAVDLATAALQEAGVESAGVNAGGDLRTFGPAGMTVAIRDPADPARFGRTLVLRDTALATSAGYFSRRKVDGIESSALVHALTGDPILHRRSVSVLAPTCMLADGLTKPVMSSTDPAHPVLARFGATALLL